MTLLDFLREVTGSFLKRWTETKVLKHILDVERPRNVAGRFDYALFR